MLLLLLACTAGPAEPNDTPDATNDTSVFDEGYPEPLPLATEPLDTCPELE